MGHLILLILVAFIPTKVLVADPSAFARKGLLECKTPKEYEQSARYAISQGHGAAVEDTFEHYRSLGPSFSKALEIIDSIVSDGKTMALRIPAERLSAQRGQLIPLVSSAEELEAVMKPLKGWPAEREAEFKRRIVQYFSNSLTGEQRVVWMKEKGVPSDVKVALVKGASTLASYLRLVKLAREQLPQSKRDAIFSVQHLEALSDIPSGWSVYLKTIMPDQTDEIEIETYEDLAEFLIKNRAYISNFTEHYRLALRGMDSLAAIDRHLSRFSSAEIRELVSDTVAQHCVRHCQTFKSALALAKKVNSEALFVHAVSLARTPDELKEVVEAGKHYEKVLSSAARSTQFATSISAFTELMARTNYDWDALMEPARELLRKAKSFEELRELFHLFQNRKVLADLLQDSEDSVFKRDSSVIELMKQFNPEQLMEIYSFLKEGKQPAGLLRVDLLVWALQNEPSERQFRRIVELTVPNEEIAELVQLRARKQLRDNFQKQLKKARDITEFDSWVQLADELYSKDSIPKQLVDDEIVQKFLAIEGGNLQASLRLLRLVHADDNHARAVAGKATTQIFSPGDLIALVEGLVKNPGVQTEIIRRNAGNIQKLAWDYPSIEKFMNAVHSAETLDSVLASLLPKLVEHSKITPEQHGKIMANLLEHHPDVPSALSEYLRTVAESDFMVFYKGLGDKEKDRVARVAPEPLLHPMFPMSPDSVAQTVATRHAKRLDPSELATWIETTLKAHPDKREIIAKSVKAIWPTFLGKAISENVNFVLWRSGLPFSNADKEEMIQAALDKKISNVEMIPPSQRSWEHQNFLWQKQQTDPNLVPGVIRLAWEGTLRKFLRLCGLQR